MITILEGPDGGGKSTLATALAVASSRTSRRAALIHHHGPYLGEDPRPHYWRSVYAARTLSVIADRAWQSEPIYGAAYRDGGDRVGIAGRRMLERAAWSARAVVGLCLPPLEACVEAWRARRGEEYLKNEAALRAVHQGYVDLAMGKIACDLPLVVLDRTRFSIATMIDILHAARDAYANSGPGYGRWAPGEVALIVGERAHNDERAPFVSSNRVGCSVWLAEHLEEHDVPERDLYWVNALDGYDLEIKTRSDFVAALRPRVVVALGDVASRWCSRAGLEFEHVAHPQFWNRNEPYALGAVLRRAFDRTTQGEI